MSAVSERVNALEKLDQNVPTRFIWSLTLLATPVAYSLFDDASQKLRRLFQGRQAAMVEPIRDDEAYRATGE